MVDKNNRAVTVKQIVVSFSNRIVSVEALLKACYWFSRDFTTEITTESDEILTVSLRPKTADINVDHVHDEFMNQALDFMLREHVSTQTAGVRDLILAKAFSESGVLEEPPAGTFGDPIEEAKTDSIFRILNNN